ncbi:MAG: polyprenyl synthetase family protein [Candidatus Omnitrophica bacterium]|nr:polyprenyl synthetase family protein [Candidatus Omnitrophota bacterium]
MLNETKFKLDKELISYASRLDQDYRLKSISPLLSAKIKDYILRPGKRIRPTLFVLGYLAYSRKPASGLWRSALSIELLHDFMLVHDDIIDKSDLRRGKPAMHKMFNDHFAKSRGIKFNGQDLAIVAGDILYALAMDAFLAIKEKPERKEKALRKFVSAALFTGCGEFIEMVCGAKTIEEISQADIYKIYDLKTAYYTFAYPLSIGATLAGASEDQIKKIFEYGVYLGRAFQIQDDILGMFANEKEIGKSMLSDLQEAKKTLLIWQACRKANGVDRNKIKLILTKKKVTLTDLEVMRQLIKKSGSLDYARRQIRTLSTKALEISASLNIQPKYKKFLAALNQKIL